MHMFVPKKYKSKSCTLLTFKFHDLSGKQFNKKIIKSLLYYKFLAIATDFIYIILMVLFALVKKIYNNISE